MTKKAEYDLTIEEEPKGTFKVLITGSDKLIPYRWDTLSGAKHWVKEEAQEWLRNREKTA